MNITFEGLGLDSRLIEGMKKQGITEPMPIQANTIQLSLENNHSINSRLWGEAGE